MEHNRAAEHDQDVLKKGMTLTQVKDAKPTLDYDPLYGQANGATDRFVAGIVISMMRFSPSISPLRRSRKAAPT